MDDSFDQHENEIRMLFYSGNRKQSTLKSIMAHMKATHNFVKRKCRYQRQFKEWGLQKNNTGTEWKSVHRKIEKRHQRGKNSVVYQSGRLIPMDKVNKAKRHNYRKTEELFQSEELPQTPEGFSVCTPVADNMPYVFINNLPSLQLLRSLQSIASNPPDDTTYESHDLYDLVLSEQGPNSLHDVLRMPRDVSLSSVAFPLLHACSNNLLSDEEAFAVMEMILESRNRDSFKALISQQTPATKVIARTLLPSAIAFADVAMVQLLLDTGISPDSSIDSGHQRPLSLAIEAGNFELAKLFINLGADVNFLSPHSWASVLAVAAGAGRYDLVRLLLDAGANVNDTRASRFILPAAASSGSIETVELLLDAGIDVNAQVPYLRASFDEDTALHVAVRRENIALVRLLLHRGARTDIVGSGSRVTVLFAAVSTDNMALVQLLLSHGANVNGVPKGDESPLCRAASRGREHLVSLLLAAGASDALSAMDVASRNGHMEIVRICFEAGAPPDDLTAGANDRMTLRAGVRAGDYPFAQRFLADRPHLNVDAPAIEGDVHWTTALSIAAEQGRLDLVKLLLRFGADVNNTDASGLTPLHGAIHSGNADLVEYLLQYGANVDGSPLASVSPLAKAAHMADPKIVQILLEAGADIVGQAEDALMMAFDDSHNSFILQKSQMQVVQLLLAHWVNLGAASANGDKLYRAKMRFGPAHLQGILSISELTRQFLAHRLLDPAEVLGFAISKGDVELVKLIFSFGCDINTEPDHDYWPLTGTVIWQSDLRILHFLLEHGANARGKAQALQVASRNDKLKAAQLLIEYGADVNADPLPLGEHAARRTALQAAAGTGNLKLVQMLLAEGAEVERLSKCSDEQGTALQFAAIAGSIPIVNELIRRGANVNARPIGRNGRTALEGAAEHGRLDMVQLLLNLEAETRGSRALRFAKREGHEGVVSLLLDNGFDDVGSDDLWSSNVDQDEEVEPKEDGYE